MKTQKPLKLCELKAIRRTLFERTGCQLKDYLIEQAFTRSSYARRYGGGSNENLEYIGDTILGYHIVRQLYDHYGTVHSDEEECIYTFRAHEKDFTALKSRIVSNRTLAAIIDDWDVCRYLIVGQSDIDNEVDKQVKIKADLFEAIIGACAVQLNWDSERMAKIVGKVLPVEEYIRTYEKENFRLPEFTASNAVNTLKELSEHERCSPPVYESNGPDALGYDKNGKPIWACSCDVISEGIRKCVFAHSKKEGKKYAAYLVLCDMFELPNEFGPSKRLNVWGFNGKELTPSPSSEYLKDF